ncbi:probable LRR receptor-like serine/threonine-protein kinase At3g47570 [Medicago truncatula]|uniref:probable LRR receptor-like serine/threonine-protein kinase At3g47570 n=1 Tax=Medicago truncatula TaxID=3880 RepID=UPI000D2F3C27|nr:probable LRR receptor-like serine/threonine-protein kinase At3g47570 [Medicago truncatula]
MFLLCFASQMLVYDWPLATFAISSSSDTDKLALLALKEKLTNGVSDSLPSWNESLHFCEWQGITCDHPHMRVAFGKPNIGCQVGRLKQLEVLNLTDNKLQGEIPTELTNCTNMKKIVLEKNQLTGKVPTWFGSMMQLSYLILNGNNLVGTIPSSLENVSSLEVITLARNHLEGNIPYSLGEIPHSIYNLSNLKYFGLGINKLFGSLPSNMNLAFPNIEIFLVGNNQLSGSFPSSISNLTTLKEFEIANNSFNGQIPLTLGRLTKLKRFNIAMNNFGIGGAFDLDFLSSLTNCTQLSTLLISQNRFVGKLLDLIGNFSTHLNSLQMQFNQIYGVIPERIGELINLTYLNIGNNYLEGTIPYSIGKLKNLGGLYLKSNKLYGNIPTSIANLTILSELYLNENKLEGSIPLSLIYCTRLEKVSFSDNKLSGDIPNQKFIHLKHLIFLHLDNNSFTGPIPSEFGKLMQLSRLSLDSNKFSGEIPKNLASCLSLTELRLGRNFLHGSIPSFLGSLRSLEILDISNNSFSSTIPFELEKLRFLKTLNLSFNNLHGEVPVGAFIIAHFLTRKPKRLPSSPSLQNENLRVTYGDLHEATNGYSSSNLLGAGSFGSVYIGSLPNFRRPIAIKVLNLETRGAAKSFIAECKSLGKMKHRNLVKILTCCSSVDYKGEDFKAIVFEFMPNMSLEKMLHDNEGSGSHNLNLTQRIDIALDVAHALDYLHNDIEQAVVHCDVKPSNVLLDDDIVAHLGDFGLARLINGSSNHSSNDQITSSTIKGTIGYVPPGRYGTGVPVSPQGDIYSFGILLLEMLTGKRPADNMFCENLSLHKFCKMKIPEGILEIVDSRLLIPFAEDRTGIVENKIRNCLVMFARIGVACSQEFPAHRMLIKDVIVKLNEIKSKFPC